MIISDQQPPWASGPGEILKHGLKLLKDDSDVNRRLAMIIIDNAVELMMKTYLGLPQRVTGLRIARNEMTQFMESFPKLLDAMERYAADRLEGINLGDIEWYHRLRNQLYHQGNGLTVERNKVEVYAELANVLFTNLFGFRLVEPEDDETKLLGEFMLAWTEFEKVVNAAAQSSKMGESRYPLKFVQAIPKLEEAGLISKAESSEINNYRVIRNEVVHGIKSYDEVLTPTIVERLFTLTSEIAQKISPALKSILGSPQKSLKFETISHKLLAEAQKGISIEYEGEKVSSVYLMEIKVSNTGNVPIVPKDYIKPIRLVFPPETKILEARVENALPPNIEVNFKVDEHCIVLSPFLLNPHDQFVVIITATNLNIDSNSNPFVLDGEISGTEA